MSLSGDLLSLDFASLRTLQLVYRLGSFSEAAESIDVKQSTVSYTINRVRKVVGDPLFVRMGAKIVPTDRCQQIMPIIESLLGDAEDLVDGGRFDPAKSTGEVTIGCVDYSTMVFLPQFLRRMRQEAKSVRVNIHSGYMEFVELLLAGQIDIAIFAAEYEGKGIYSQNLIDDDFAVCIMDKANPLVGRRLTEAEVANASHMLAMPFRTFKAAYVTEAERRNIEIRSTYTVGGVTELPVYLKGTDLVAGMPSRLAQIFSDQVGIAAFPFKARIQLNMFWTAVSHRSKLNAWVRGLIAEEAAALPPPREI